MCSWFYIQITNEHIHCQMEGLNEKLYSIQMEETFYIYKWAYKLRKFYIQMRSSTYKWDTNDTLSITWWICYTANHNNSCAIAHARIISLWNVTIALSSIYLRLIKVITITNYALRTLVVCFNCIPTFPFSRSLCKWESVIVCKPSRTCM